MERGELFLTQCEMVKPIPKQAPSPTVQSSTTSTATPTVANHHNFLPTGLQSKNSSLIGGKAYSPVPSCPTLGAANPSKNVFEYQQAPAVASLPGSGLMYGHKGIFGQSPISMTVPPTMSNPFSVDRFYPPSPVCTPPPPSSGLRYRPQFSYYSFPPDPSAISHQTPLESSAVATNTVVTATQFPVVREENFIKPKFHQTLPAPHRDPVLLNHRRPNPTSPPKNRFPSNAFMASIEQKECRQSTPTFRPAPVTRAESTRTESGAGRVKKARKTRANRPARPQAPVVLASSAHIVPGAVRVKKHSEKRANVPVFPRAPSVPVASVHIVPAAARIKKHSKGRSNVRAFPRAHFVSAASARIAPFVGSTKKHSTERANIPAFPQAPIAPASYAAMVPGARRAKKTPRTRRDVLEHFQAPIAPAASSRIVSAPGRVKKPPKKRMNVPAFPRAPNLPEASAHIAPSAGRITKPPKKRASMRPSSARAFACPFSDCSDRFYKKWQVKSHIDRVHMKERFHACGWDGCNRSDFQTVFDLERHVSVVHKKRKVFTCPVPGCSKTFGQVSHLNCHVLNRNLHRSRKN